LPNSIYYCAKSIALNLTLKW